MPFNPRKEHDFEEENELNFVYEKDKLTPLTPKQLAKAANLVNPFGAYSEADFDGANDRVQRIECFCRGNGEFELLPPEPNDLRRTVKCRLCGAVRLL